MKLATPTIRCGWLFGITSVLLLVGSSLQAGEPAREFLDELRRVGYHDIALEYLEQMSNSSLAPVTLKEVLPYERAVTLIQGTVHQPDRGLREKMLDEAQVALQQFIGQRSDHPLASSAKSQLGNLLQKRASMKVEFANSPNGQSQKATLLKEARALYEEAYTVFENSRNELKAKLESMKKAYNPETEKKEIAIRDQYRQDYLQALLLAAAIKEEMADTETEGGEAYKKLLTEAAEAYGFIYDNYRTRLAGLYARMYQGRCFQKIGNLSDALSYYAELLEQPDDPEAFRNLKTKVMLRAIECWCHPSQKKFVVAIAQGAAWVDKVRPVESRTDDWMQLRLKLAEAYQLYADYVQKEKVPNPQLPPKNSISEARQLATYVARYQSEYQDQAKRMLAMLRGVDPDADDGKEVDPQNFAEAKTAGKEALDAVSSAKLVMKLVPPRLEQEKDEKIRAELQEQIKAAQETLATGNDKAIRLFSKALELSDSETDPNDIKVVYYFLSFLHYIKGNFFEAALIGEHLSRRHPDAPGARPSAKIAMASFLKLYGENKNADKGFETDGIIRTASYITEKWPDEPESIDALNTLIPFMIQSGDLDQAQAYLKQIPEDSAKRGGAELKTGQAMWGAYLRGMAKLQEDEGPGDPAAQAKLAALKDQAQQILSDGVTRMKSSGVIDETMATAVLSLAQIYVDTEQAPKAVVWLEDPDVGALTLVTKNHAATKQPGFVEETLKTSLRAYIASLSDPANTERPRTIAKAKGVMGVLKKITGSTPDGQKKLVAIYISLANDLKEQMNLITSPQAKKALSEGYATFLEQVSAGSTELNVLNWVAETFSGMAESLKAESPAEAKKFNAQAVTTYGKILDQGKSDPEWLPKDIRVQIQMRLAMTLRETGEFEKAVDIFEVILKERNMTLNVQVEAAKTYQEWGQVPGQEENYDKANKGGRYDKKTKKNTIWGWIQLSKLTGRYPQYRDVFYESRYNLAVSHFELAMRQKSADDKSRYLKYAKNDVLNTKRLYPDLGGAKWTPKYDQILRKVQRALGEKVTGIEGLTPATPTSAKSGT